MICEFMFGFPFRRKTEKVKKCIYSPHKSLLHRLLLAFHRMREVDLVFVVVRLCSRLSRSDSLHPHFITNLEIVSPNTVISIPYPMCQVLPSKSDRSLAFASSAELYIDTPEFKCSH